MQLRSIEERNKLVAQWKPLANKVARQYEYICNVEYADLFQVGCIGLIKAAERWDASRQSHFYNYAHVNIRGEILHYIRDHSYSIRFPRDRKNGPSRHIASLNEPASIYNRFGHQIEEKIDCLSAKEEEEDVTLPDLQPALDQFTERQKAVFEKIYFEGKTQTEAAKELNCSQMSVSRDVVVIKEKLRTLAY